MNTLYVTVGAPGSGKSTWWKSYCIDSQFKQHEILYINMDTIRKDLTGSEIDQTQNNRVAEIAHSTLMSGLSLGTPFICWDNTSAKSSYRKKVIQMAKQAQYRAVAIVFDIPLSVCLHRNSLRDRKVPEDVIMRMWTNIKENPPSYDEGFSEIWTYTG